MSDEKRRGPMVGIISRINMELARVERLRATAIQHRLTHTLPRLEERERTLRDVLESLDTKEPLRMVQVG